MAISYRKTSARAYIEFDQTIALCILSIHVYNNVFTFDEAKLIFTEKFLDISCESVHWLGSTNIIHK